MDNLKILYNISEKYWVELSDSEPTKVIGFYKIDISKLEFYNDKVASGALINSLFGLKFIRENECHIKLTLSNKAFCVKEASSEYSTKIDEKVIHLTENVCNSFRLNYKKELLRNIFVEKCDIKQTLREINKYIFCNHYSLWLHNDITDYFTLLDSSFVIKQTFKKPNDKNFSEEHICEKFDYSGNTDELKSIKSLNRIKITLPYPNKENNLVYLIVNFFSEYDDYSLKEETILLIKEILYLKFSKDYFPKIIASNRYVADLNNKFKIRKFDDYLKECVDTITNDLEWEAASIFIKDNDECLKLKALKHAGNYDHIGTVMYTKDDKPMSMTYNALKENKTVYSYDIKNDPRNTHKFDDETINVARNWLGVPISAPKIPPIGVVRVKNKLKDKETVNFGMLDINILENLATNIAYQYNIEQKFIKEEDFRRTSRHEIKTPLTLITNASVILKYRIHEEYKLNESDDLPKKIRELLEDLNIVASRLLFITNSKSFDAKELVKEIKSTSIFKDVVIPVISFSKGYARKKHRFIDIDKNSILQLPLVNCDAASSQMALHIVIDNAIKYTKKYETIFVYGKKEGDYCKVIVESDSFVAIQPDEKDDIFKKYYRTKEVEERKFEGSGIGLFLAKGIMRENGGKILLTSLNKPTRFELHFLKNKVGD
jgi:signal transduction histidine kinase